jgi:hypothetical protein
LGIGRSANTAQQYGPKTAPYNDNVKVYGTEELVNGFQLSSTQEQLTN